LVTTKLLEKLSPVSSNYSQSLVPPSCRIAMVP
jgi:hypothetical protein